MGCRSVSEAGLGDGRPRLLLVTTEPQPPPYHSLREIFGRLLPARGYDVGWVLTDRVSELAGADGWRPRGTVWTIGTAHRRAGAPLAATHLRRRTETAALRAAVARGEWD